MSEWSNYQFTIDIDGYGPSWKFFHCLSMGMVVFKFDSDFQQFFYPHLKPFIHYIPVRNDFSDLHSKIEWALSNPGLTNRISKAASHLARQLNYEWCLKEFLRCLP
jgi:protein glucosyltransferase